MIRKALAFLLFILSLANASVAQEGDTVPHQYVNQVDVLYALSCTGHQVLLNYNHHWGRHAVVAGFRHFFDSDVHQPYSRLEGWRFRKPSGYGFFHRIGLSLGYEYHLFKAPRAFDLYAFGQIQHENYLLATNPGVPLSSEGPFTVIEAVVGWGVQREFYPRVSVDVSLGAGSVFFIDDGVRVVTSPSSTFDGDFSERTIVLRVGVSYALR